jgi:ATP synthase F1 delta subunit
MSDVYTVSREYGRALFLLTEEVGSTERVRREAEALSGILSSNPDYLKMLDTPALTPDERIELIDGAMSGLDEHLLNLVRILTKRRMAYAIPRVLFAFGEAYMESRGIVKAEVISAVALDNGQREWLSAKLRKITGKEIIIENRVDPSVLGGIKLRYMGIQRDGSVKARLDGFAEALRGAVI